MSSHLPRDDNGFPIPVLSLRPDGAHKIAAGPVSQKNAAAFAATTRVVSIYATGPVFMRFGGADVAAAATDHYFPAGVYYDFSVQADQVKYTHAAFLQAATGCDVYISEKE